MKAEYNKPLNKNYANKSWLHFLSWFLVLFFIFAFDMNKPTDNSFKTEQKKMARVQQAYTQKEAGLKTLLAEKGLEWNNFSLLITAYKNEKLLKVYARSAGDAQYTLLKSYDFCVLSGQLGPKRKEGDGQVPEGLYEITRFNPASNFHLSLKINYPNSSDLILGDKTQPGSDIFIHGHCVSVGCIPITDPCIEELYVLCVEAWNRKQHIPVYIFPFEMSEGNWRMFKALGWSSDVENLWSDLKGVYDEFVKKPDVIDFTIDKKGRYRLR